MKDRNSGFWLCFMIFMIVVAMVIFCVVLHHVESSRQIMRVTVERIG